MRALPATRRRTLPPFRSPVVGSPPTPHPSSLLPGDNRREPTGQPFQRGAAVPGIEVDVQQAEAGRVGQRGRESGVELLLGPDLQAEADAEDLGDLVEGPVMDVVERPLQEETFGGVAV